MVDTPRLSLKVGGQWLRQFGAWGDLAYSFAWPGGCREASWSMTTKFPARLPVLTGRPDVQVMLGSWPLWRGYLPEPDWSGNTVTLTANGLYRLGEEYPALDDPATMNAATNPTTALNFAIGLGLPWTIDTATVPNVDLDATPTDPQTITSLLDLWTAQSGLPWYVDNFGVVRFVANPTVPSLIVRTGSGDLGIAPDSYASNLVLNYNDSGAGTFKRVAYPPLTGPMDDYGDTYGRKISLQDITDKGSMSAAVATNLAQNAYLMTKQRPGWTNGLQLNYGEVLTPGGMQVHPATINTFGGLMAQLNGVRDAVALTAYTQFLAGVVEYTQANPTQVTINPVGLAARTTEDVLTELISAGLSSGAIAA